MILVEHPPAAFPKLLILGLEQAHQLLEVDDRGLWLRHNVHVLVEHVTRVHASKALRELLVSLLLLTAVRASERPVEETFVGVVQILSVYVLQKGIHVTIGDPRCVVLEEHKNNFRCVSRLATFQSFSFTNRPYEFVL